MKISIITATWNSGATLRDTLDSVLAQTYKDYELLIQDGGSSDETLKIVEEYIPQFGGRLKCVSEKDNGLYDAMNRGIARATGDAVGMLNSDDFYADANVLADIAEGLEGCDAVYGDLVFVSRDDTGKAVRTWRGSQYRDGGFFRGWHPAHPTFYARRELFGRYGPFDTSFDVSADFELMFRFIEKNKAASRYIPRTFVKMRCGGESTGSLSKIWKGNRNVVRAFEKNGFKAPPLYLVRRLLPKIINVIQTGIKIRLNNIQ